MLAAGVEERGVRVYWSDRWGGVSPPPFDTANLGFSAGDDPAWVAENRRRLAVACAASVADPAQWTWLAQVHGAEVAEAHAGGGSGRRTAPRADAVVVVAPGAVAAVLVADCGPVALVGEAGVAAVHAGWRGVMAGVLEAAAGELTRLSGHLPVRGLIGPCIRPCCYEFGISDLGPIAARLGDAVVGRTGAGRPALDLPAAITVALRRAGVRRVDDSGLCTACSPDHFSARRDGMRTGRQALVVELLR